MQTRLVRCDVLEYIWSIFFLKDSVNRQPIENKGFQMATTKQRVELLQQFVCGKRRDGTYALNRVSVKDSKCASKRLHSCLGTF